MKNLILWLTMTLSFALSAQATSGKDITIHGKITKIESKIIMIQHDGMLFTVKNAQILGSKDQLRVGNSVVAHVSRDEYNVAKLNAGRK